MSTTTETQTSSVPLPSPPPAAPELTIITRVASIPMISSSLESLNGALSSNAYTRSPYCTAKGLSTSAYKYTEPLQIRLAPLIIRADGYANKAVDVVESRYPYPFKAKPEEVASYVRDRRRSASEYVRERKASAVTVANKTIDEKVKSPAFNVAQGIDQRFAPIMDYFEGAVTRLNAEAGPSTPTDSKYQYQRALAISKNLKDHLYVYSNEQLKQIQAQSVLVQRATETAQTITTLASSSLTSAQTRIHALSDTMLLELQKLQSSTASLSTSLQSSASSHISSTAGQFQSQIPPHIQQTYTDLSTSLSATIADLRAIVTAKELPLQEKVSQIGVEVRERVTPVLEGVKKGVTEILARGSAVKPEANGVNGTGNGYAPE